MATFAVSMVRNEADIIGPVIRHMLTQVDHVIVADNGSTDGTRDILDALPITVVDDPEPAYYQADKMTALAHRARAEGAVWVVPFDADEWWYSPFGRIADVCQQFDTDILAADLYDHVATGTDDHDQPDPTRRIGWRRRKPAALPKVAAAATVDLRIHMGNHGADHGPDRPKPRRTGGQLVVRHFPYRSPQQFINKVRAGAAALAATDLAYDVGRHWRDYGRLTDEQLRAVFAEHFWADQPWTRPDLILDPAP